MSDKFTFQLLENMKKPVDFSKEESPFQQQFWRMKMYDMDDLYKFYYACRDPFEVICCKNNKEKIVSDLSGGVEFFKSED